MTGETMFEKTLNTLMEKRKDNHYKKIFYQFGLINVDAIRTWTKKEELRALYNQAIRLEKHSNALEIGSYLGASTCYIAAGIAKRDGHLTCVDTWNNETIPEGEKNTFSDFERNVTPMKNYITVIKRNTFELTAEDFPDKYSFVFIDGDHSYSAVKNDFRLVEDITTNKAIVLFHDAIFFEGVTRTIGEALSEGNWGIGGLVNNLFWIIKN